MPDNQVEYAMKEVIKGFRKIVYLSFPPEVSGRPVVCNLTRLFDLSFNILKADISPRHEGAMTLELSGLEEDFHKGIGYLKENGIRITPGGAQDIQKRGILHPLRPVHGDVPHRRPFPGKKRQDRHLRRGQMLRVRHVHPRIARSKAMTLDPEDGRQ